MPAICQHNPPLVEPDYVYSAAEDTEVEEVNYPARVAEQRRGGAGVGAPPEGLCHPSGTPRAPAPSVSLLFILLTLMLPPDKKHVAPTPRPPGSQPEVTVPPRTHLAMSGDIFCCHNLAGRGILLGLVVEVRDLLGTAAPHRRQLHDSSDRRGSPCSRENRLPFPDASRGLPVRRMRPCAWSLSQMWAPTHLQMW